jgi:hypothetical protein
MPSSSAPSTRELDADAPAPAAVPVGSLRFSAPIRSITQSPTKNVKAPAVSPTTTGTAPARSYAAPVNSKATALISTPTPNPITNPTSRIGTDRNRPTNAPISREAPPTNPQKAASSTC